jgi:hypothetical protein
MFLAHPIAVGEMRVCEVTTHGRIFLDSESYSIGNSIIVQYSAEVKPHFDDKI